MITYKCQACGATFRAKRNANRRFCSKLCYGSTFKGLKRDVAIVAKHTKHGHCTRLLRSREYRSWEAMKSRCLNHTVREWPNYGGRGISICERWINSFENFLSDMGLRPPRTTLDRKNNDGNYEPGNCRWATKTQQRRNMRPGKFHTLRGR